MRTPRFMTPCFPIVLLVVSAFVFAACESGSGPGIDASDTLSGDALDTDGGSDSVGDVPLDSPDLEPDIDLDAAGDLDDPGGPLGWIGSPCDSVADCTYDAAVCLGEAPDGMCSLECDMYCPDLDGYPTTFCVDVGALPPEAPGFLEGACFSRCDYGLFPGTGCREGYGCVPVPRANDPATEISACIPGEESPPLSTCQEQLASLGVSFEPTTHTPESPDTHPSLTCTIEDPVILHPPIHGVVIDTPWGPSSSILAACAMALALVATVDDVAAHGAVRLSQMGTYNCRVIAGTDSLSRHAYGDAIDLAGFELEDGSVYTLVDDWEHDTTAPSTPGGQFLYEASMRWYDDWIWNTILTPNYNSDHDDHFHVDLTPDRHFIGALPGAGFGHYIGPAPYDD